MTTCKARFSVGNRPYDESVTECYIRAIEVSRYRRKTGFGWGVYTPLGRSKLPPLKGERRDDRQKFLGKLIEAALQQGGLADSGSRH